MTERETAVVTVAQQLIRPFVTYTFTLTVCLGFLFHLISVEAFMAIAAAVITFWFGAPRQDRRATDDGSPRTGERR